MAGTAPFTGLALVLAIVAAALMVIGGTKLWSLDTYRLAMIGAIAALIPFSPLWAISMPIGLWALMVLLRSDVQAWFDVEAGEEPRPLAATMPVQNLEKPLPPRDNSVEAIRRRVAGPAIGLMIVGLLGLLPCAAMLLAIPALVIFPARDQEASGPWVSPSAGAAVLPTFAVATPPVLLAQGDAMHSLDTMARGPLWGVIFIGLTVLLSLPLSLVMIIGGWQNATAQVVWPGDHRLDPGDASLHGPLADRPAARTLVADRAAAAGRARGV